MKQFGAFDAKTHFSEILGNVMKGEEVVITKHGVQVAMIIPFKKDEEVTPVENAIRTLKNFRKGITLGENLSIQQMIDEGRK